ncbi:MAG: hypothetical protein LC772_08645 [Chloroflexi bacterium]|nr:hypothetical protein [Chloroflexota bacterium]
MFLLLQSERRDGSVPLCQQLHYLQMATEKLAKSHLTSGASPPTRSHDAFVKFLRVAKRRPDVRKACGYYDAAMFTAFIDSILPKAQAIEDLSPEGAEHPNPEYRWQVGADVVCPVDHPFADLQLHDVRMIKLIKAVNAFISFS